MHLGGISVNKPFLSLYEQMLIILQSAPWALHCTGYNVLFFSVWQACQTSLQLAQLTLISLKTTERIQLLIVRWLHSSSSKKLCYLNTFWSNFGSVCLGPIWKFLFLLISFFLMHPVPFNNVIHIP